jgi:hypothetical protein
MGKSGGKRLLERFGCRKENNIKTGSKEIGRRRWTGLISSG